MKKLIQRSAIGLLSLSAICFSSCDSKDSNRLQNLPGNVPTGYKPVQLFFRKTTTVGIDYDDLIGQYNWVFEYNKRNQLQMGNGLYVVSNGETNSPRAFHINYNDDHELEIKINTNNGIEEIEAEITNDLITHIDHEAGESCSHTNIFYKNQRIINVTNERTAAGSSTHPHSTRCDDHDHPSTYEQSANFIWEGENLKRIEMDIHDGMGERETIIAFEYTDKPNVSNTLIDQLFMPLNISGMEFVYYAGLLGKTSKNLVKSITTEDGVINMDYSLDQYGNVLKSKQIFESGKVIETSYQYMGSFN